MKYGLYSVEAMLNEMYKLGCKKENMSAKILGGADITNLGFSFQSIGVKNVDFANTFCKAEGFKILLTDTRGTYGRIVFLGKNFEISVKNLDNNNISKNVVSTEIKLQKEISTTPSKEEQDQNILFF
jgi:chemotaxis protein CheD